MLTINPSFVLLIVFAFAVNRVVDTTLMPLSRSATKAITDWMGTPLGELKEYMANGICIEIEKSSNLVGFAAKVGLYSFLFEAPYFGFTAEYIAKGGAEKRRDYPSLLAGAKVMRIVANIKLGGHDKSDLDYEINATSHVVNIYADDEKITKPKTNSVAIAKYDRLIQETIADLGRAVRDKVKVMVFGAQKFDLTE